MSISFNKKLSLVIAIAVSATAGFLFFGFDTSAASNASVSFKKDNNKLFVITFKDHEGIRAFSLDPAGDKAPYGGELGGCPELRVLDNVSYFKDDDFSPELAAVITDCEGNIEELKIPPLKDGITKNLAIKVTESSVVKSASTASVSTGSSASALKKAAEKEKEFTKKRKAEIKYPVTELGNCRNESACHSFCENSENIKACIAFAEKHEILSKEEIDKGKKFIKVLDEGGGPGECRSEADCRAYCEDSSKADECIVFAEKHGFMSEEELVLHKRMLLLVKSGETPGGCKSKVACEIYCSSSDNIEVCLEFAEKNNVMPPEELALAKKFLPLMKSGETPGGCKSKGQCESYCQTPEHMRECIAFAEKNGVMSPKELEEAKKVLPYLEKGETPGGCKSKAQCETYCDAEGNLEECMAFAEKVGFITKEEAEAIKKAGGKGPGGCKSKEQCETFCQDPAHTEECIDFAVKAGFVTEEDAEIMRKTGGKGPGNCKSKADCEEYCKDASHNEECTDFAVNAGFINPAQADLMKQLGCTSEEECKAACGLPENKDKCQAMMGMMGGGTGGGIGTGGFGGPGGCKSQEECMAYCKEHQEECKNFMPPGGTTGGGFPGGGATGGQFPGSGATGGSFPGGPGGCKNQEECNAYCQSHQEECKNFNLPAGGGLPGGSTGGSGFNGPGGCQNIEECKTYCTAHYTDTACSQYIGGGGTGSGPGGCTSQAECQAYCEAHPQECGGVGPAPLPPPQSIQSCVPPPSGLVSWWDDESVLDASHGVSVTPGKVGNALKFDGEGGYVNDGNPASLNFGTGPFSLEAWINWDGKGSSVNNIIRKSNYPFSGTGSGYWLRIGRDSKILEFSIGATTGPVGQNFMTAPVSPGIWHYVVATRDSAGATKLYVDGQSKGVVVRKALNAESTSEAPLTLGAWDDRFGITEFFSGLMDEVSIYNGALSAAEVQAIYNAGSFGKCHNSSGSTGSSLPPPSSFPTTTQYPSADQYQIPQDFQIDCKLFEIAPSCSYLGSPGIQAYDLCKKCFPNK